MLVRLGGCVPELNTSKCTSFEDNVYTRLEYNISRAEYMNTCGFSHVRFNNILGSGFSRSEMQSVLESDRIKSLAKWLTLANYTTSIHVPYKYNFFTIQGATKTLKYINDLDKVLELVNMKHCALNMHVKCHDNQTEVFFTRFMKKLSFSTKEKLVLENDDRILNMQGTLEIAKRSKIGFVYDNLHDKLNKSPRTLEECMPDINETWKYCNTKPILHYSSGDSGGHGTNVVEDDLLKVLYLYKKYFDEVIVIVEIKDAMQGIEKFRFTSSKRIAWLDDYRFII